MYEVALFKRLVAVLAVLLLTPTMTIIGCSSDSQESVTPADFYEGKTINLVVSSKAGSRPDLIARTTVAYLERDTAANVVVTNMAGASGLDGMNYLYRSEPDGLTLGIVSIGKFVANKVMDETAAAYEVEDFSYIMNIGKRPSYFMISPDGLYQSVEELQAGENLKVAGGSPSGPVSLGGLTVIELLDLDAKVVTGIIGESSRSLSVKRGEIVGYVIGVEVAKVSIDSGLAEPMFVLATARDSLRPDVPAITELADIAEEDLALVELWETALVSSDIIAAPPGMPEDRLEFLRALAAEWTQDAEFRAEINRVSGYEVQSYAIGDTVVEAMLNFTTALDDYRALFAELIEKYRA
jgi:tripartite-type tricarboxylate transporter receptor subunit TctC